MPAAVSSLGRKSVLDRTKEESTIMFLKAKRFLPLLLVVALLALSVSPALVGAQTENGFDAEDGVVVSGTVDITGYADDPNFVKWDLFVLPGGDDTSKIWVATGEEAGEFSVTIDTTMFPDGDHALSLRIVKSPTYNYDEYLLNFTIDNSEEAES